MELRYMGFDQQKNTRTYRFDRIARGEPTTSIVMTVDIALFLKHRIGIQEGPALCSHKLALEGESLAAGHHELTNQDLLAYAEARNASIALKASVRSKGVRRRPVSELHSSAGYVLGEGR